MKKGSSEFDYFDSKTSNDSAYQFSFSNYTYDEYDENFSTPYDYENDLQNDEYVEMKGSSSKSCKCLPSCSSIRYNAEISQTKVKNQNHLRANQIFDDEEEK